MVQNDPIEGNAANTNEDDSSRNKEMLSDTHPDAESVRQEILRKMTFSEKFSLVRSMTATVVSLCRQGIRERHPEYDEQEVSIHFVEMNYGRELAEGMRRRLEQDALKEATKERTVLKT